MSSPIAARIGRVLIVGGGRMGTAICEGILRLDGVKPDAVTVANPGVEKRERIERELGVRTVADAADGLPADTIILAVKPARIAEVSTALKDAGIGAAVVISIAAGISTGFLEGVFGSHTPVVRVMPNTPLLVGRGMSAVSPGKGTPAGVAELARDLFMSMGRAVIVAEEQQDLVTAISGSGPAYFELVVEVLGRSGVELGLDRHTAIELALQTMYGTAVLLDETGQDPVDAIEAVSSPGGTTVAALETMRREGIEEALADGVRAAFERSKELGKPTC